MTAHKYHLSRTHSFMGSYMDSVNYTYNNDSHYYYMSEGLDR